MSDQSQKKTILVVEDEKALVAAIKKKLEINGLSVVTARSVDQALGYLEDVGNIDAVWLDHYLLGQEDGLDLVAKVKDEQSPVRNVPIYVVSNTATAEKVQTYLRFGVTKYFVKAENRLDEIIEEMKNHLTNGEGE